MRLKNTYGSAIVRQGLVIAFLSAVLPALPALAGADSLIEGAKLCTRHLPRYEREYGVPTHLLSAIASTESGRYHQGLRINIPWPWTINAEGKGYYYPTKSEAVAAARKFKARGIQSIDVGCMQVNLHHHSHAFKSLEDAFEPEKNIAYAASFLRSLYEADRSWKQAAGGYHSKTPTRGGQYAGKVYNSWYTIIDRLRQAKLQVPESTVAVMKEMKKEAARPAAGKVVKVAAKTARSLPEQRGKKVVAHQSPRMNSISVSKKNASSEHGITIIRPEVKVVDSLAPAAGAVKPASLTLAQAAAPDPAVAHTEAGGVKKPGPNFIFND